MKRSIYGGTKILPSGKHSLLNGEWKVDPYIIPLQQLGISDWEQVHSLLINEDSKQRLFRDVLYVPEEQQANFINAAREAVPPANLPGAQGNAGLLLPLGAKKPTEGQALTRKKLISQELTISNLHSLTKLSALTTLSASASFQLASSVNYVSQLPPVKTQGERGTCVAFAVTAINEFYFSRKIGTYTDLSEQYLFCETKKIEGDDACSSHIANALNVLSNSGQCPENVWSYNPNAPCIQQDGEPSNADQYAIPYRNGYVPYDADGDLIMQMKSSLTIGQLIAFSIPVFHSWYNSTETTNSGRITMPLANEPVMVDDAGNEEGHAMAIVGYQDSVEYPGGGYFIVRNSWGAQIWGTHNVYGPGYGTIPYQYISDFHWEVYGI